MILSTLIHSSFLFVFLRNSPQWARASSFTRFLDHTQRRTTVGRTPLGELSARRRDLYLTTRNTHNRQTSKPPVGFETHNLSRRAATDLRFRLRGYWDRLIHHSVYWISFCPHSGQILLKLPAQLQRFSGPEWQLIQEISLYHQCIKQVKQSRYRSEVAQRVPGS